MQDPSEIEQKVTKTIIEITPQIEEQIKSQLNLEYEQFFQQQVKELKIRAKQQCEQLAENKIEDIHKDQLMLYNQRRKLFEKRQKELEIAKIQTTAILENDVIQKLQQQSQNNSNNNKKQQLQQQQQSSNTNDYNGVIKEIRERMNREWQERKAGECKKKETLMRLNYKRKLEEECEQMRQQLAESVNFECSKQIEDIDKQRAEIAKMTAQQNLKIKQCQEEKKTLLDNKQEMEQHCQNNIQQFESQLQELYEEYNALLQQQQQQHQQQQQTLYQQQQQGEGDEGEQEQQLLQYPQQQYYQQEQHYEDEQEYPQDYNQKGEEQLSQSQHRGEWIMNQSDIIKRNNLFANQENNNNNNIQIQNTFLNINENSNYASNKSPFLLSLTRKLKATNPDFAELGKQLEESEKIIPSGIDLFPHQQPLFQSGDQSLEKDKAQTLNNNFAQAEMQKTSKFTPLKEYNTASMAEKILEKIREEIQSNNSKNVPQSPSQQFSKLFGKEIAATLNEKLNNESYLSADQTRDEDKVKFNKENQDKHSVHSSLTFNENNQSRYQIALSEEIPDKRKTVKKERVKQKIIPNRQLSKYEMLLSVNEQDNDKSRKLKQLHQNVQQQLENEIVLQQQLQSLQESIFSSFLPQISEDEVKQDLTIGLQDLIYAWERSTAPIESRIAFLQDIFSTDPKQKQEIRQKLRFESEYTESIELSEQERQLQLLLDTRWTFKKQVDTKGQYFSYKNNKRIYQSIKSLDAQIQQLLSNNITLTHKKNKFLWRGIDPEEILILDKFEEDLLQKNELTEEISRKVGKKF